MNTNPNITCDFEKEVVEGIPAAIPTGIGTYDRREYCVSVSKGVATLAEALAQGLRVRTLRNPLEYEDIERMLTNLVRLRCLQVTRRLPASIRPGEILVPDFFMPFLAHIVKVDLPLSSVEFTPRWLDDEETSEETQDGQRHCEGSSELKAVVDDLTKTVRILKQCGVRVSTGLPRILIGEDDGLLRIRETEEGEFLVAGGAPAETDLLIRSVIRIGFQPEFFGEARTRYSRVEDYDNSLWRLVETAYQRLS